MGKQCEIECQTFWPYQCKVTNIVFFHFLVTELPRPKREKELQFFVITWFLLLYLNTTLLLCHFYLINNALLVLCCSSIVQSTLGLVKFLGSRVNLTKSKNFPKSNQRELLSWGFTQSILNSKNVFTSNRVNVTLVIKIFANRNYIKEAKWLFLYS